MFKIGDRVKVKKYIISSTSKRLLGQSGFITKVAHSHKGQFFILDIEGSQPSGIWSSEIELDTAWHNEQKLKQALGLL